jgi:hypothetical protein
MNDWPRDPDPSVLPQFIHSYSCFCPAMPKVRNLINAAVGIGNITWVANVGVWCPISLPFSYPVRRVFWGNGSTLTTSNAEFAIYNGNGVRIYTTGSVAMSGAGAPQYVDPTDFLLPGGRYFFAFTCDNTTNRVRGATAITTIAARQAGIFQKASVAPGSLPATMVGGLAAAQAIYPLCGITRTPSGF